MAAVQAVSAVLLCALAAAASGGNLTAGGVDCGVPGCLFAGGCRQTYRVMCDFRGTSSNQINIQSRSFRPSLQSLIISNVKSLRVSAGALRSLSSLQHIQLLSINSIVLEEGSMSLVNSTHVSVTLDGVDRLTVAPRAFSGWGRPGCRILLRNITHCDIAAGAFPTAVPPTATVTLENMASLELAPGAFADSITALSFSNVTMTHCRSGTFSGRLQSLSLRSVALHVAKRGCLRADGWRALTITSSQLRYINTDSFSGDIKDVLLQDNSVYRLDGGAVRLNVTRFTARACRFNELRPDALQVTASRSVLLQDVTVNTLRQDAFRHLRLDGGDVEGIRIERLRVNRADEGALRFADSAVTDDSDDADTEVDAEGGGSGVTLSGLVFGTPCACGVKERAHRLLSWNDEERARRSSDGDAPLLQSLLAARCVDTENESTPTLAGYELQRCAGAAPTSAPRADTWPVSRLTATVAVPLLILILLLIAATTLLCLRRRMQARQRRSVSKHGGCRVTSADAWLIPSARSSVPGATRGSPGGCVGGSPGGFALNAAPSTAAAGKASCECRAPPPQSVVSSEMSWTYVREPSDASLEGLYDVPGYPAGWRSDGQPAFGDSCASGPPEPGTDSTDGTTVQVRVRYESEYDVVRGPPVATCSCQWRASEWASRSADSGSRAESPVYQSLCTCRPRRVADGGAAR